MKFNLPYLIKKRTAIFAAFFSLLMSPCAYAAPCGVPLTYALIHHFGIILLACSFIGIISSLIALFFPIILIAWMLRKNMPDIGSIPLLKAVTLSRFAALGANFLIGILILILFSITMIILLCSENFIIFLNNLLLWKLGFVDILWTFAIYSLCVGLILFIFHVTACRIEFFMIQTHLKKYLSSPQQILPEIKRILFKANGIFYALCFLTDIIFLVLFFLAIINLN